MKKTCRFCNNEIEYDAHLEYARHCSGCISNPNRGAKLSRLGKFKMERRVYSLICRKCNKEYNIEIKVTDYLKNKFRKHCSRSCANGRVQTDEINKKRSISAKKSEKVRLANHKRDAHFQERICCLCGNKFYCYKSCKKHLCSKKCYLDACKKHLLNQNNGGYRKGSGLGKHGWYKGFWCDSSWELAYVIYCLEHRILIQRNTKKFGYIFKGKKFFYIPDYTLNDQRYVEVKGYVNEKWQAKVNQFPYMLTILGKKEIKPILQYVTKKYGKNFIKMYEK